MAIRVDEKRKDELIEEIYSLYAKNIDLYKLIDDLSKFVKDEYNKDVVITSIYRSQSKQDEIYSDNPKYTKKPWKSPHQFFHGVDLRSRIYSETEIKNMLLFLNKHNQSNYYKFTAIYHEVGTYGKHFHINYVEK